MGAGAKVKGDCVVFVIERRIGKSLLKRYYAEFFKSTFGEGSLRFCYTEKSERGFK